MKVYGRIVDHRTSISSFTAILLLSAGCVSKHAPTNQLTQEEPRAISKSLRIPESASVGPVIPGLKQGAVPQGMSYWEKNDLLLTSHYFTTETPSCIVSMDWKTGTVLNTTQLMESDGSPHMGHVGGIIVESSNLWIASDAFLYRYVLNDFLTNTSAKATARYATEATREVAFCTVYDGLVWAGEFALGNKYATDPTHHLTARDGDERKGWVCGYDPGKAFSGAPEKVLSIPDRAQGIVITDDLIFLTLSYGRRNRSSIEIFKNPLGEEAHLEAETSEGEPVPLWFLDGGNLIRSIDLPPMAENIQIIDGKGVVLFESGAQKFKRFGKKPLDHILLLNLKELAP